MSHVSVLLDGGICLELMGVGPRSQVQLGARQRGARGELEDLGGHCDGGLLGVLRERR